MNDRLPGDPSVPRRSLALYVLTFVLLASVPALAEEAPNPLPTLPTLPAGMTTVIEHSPDHGRRWMVMQLHGGVAADDGPEGGLHLVTLERFMGDGRAGLAVGTSLDAAAAPSRAGLKGVLAESAAPDTGVQTLCVAAPDNGPMLLEIFSRDNGFGVWRLGHEMTVPGDARCAALPLS